jgi:hypothetical protein
MKFSAFLEGLSGAQRREAVQAWQKCRLLLIKTEQRQFVINLEDDCHLCEAAWVSLRDVILTSVSDAIVLQRELTNACRKHTLQGSFIARPFPSPLGRAVTKELFADLLREQFSFNTIDEEDQFMDDLLYRRPTAASTIALLSGKLLTRSGRVMWGTFNFDPTSGTPVDGSSPFNNMPRDADGIRAQLGLSKNDAGKDLLLFVYTLPPGVVPRFPTIAEAYAGNDWPYYFRPARESESWGFTMTWDSSPPLPSSPEVVHEPITGDNLVEEIKIARSF